MDLTESGPTDRRGRLSLWVRLAAATLAVALFGVMLLLYNASLDATADVQTEGGPDARPSLDHPVVCRAISGRGDTDHVVPERGSDVRVSPLYGDTSDILRSCSDARANQGTRILLWAVPTILLGVIAVTPRRGLDQRSTPRR